MLRQLGLVIFGFVAILLALEVFVRVSHLDVRFLFRYAYYVEGDFHYANARQIYQPSEVPGRLYEAIPEARAICHNCVHPKEDSYKENLIEINKHGFRGPRQEITTGGDDLRVLVLGGSNTFGISVTNPDTYPRLLEGELTKLGVPGKKRVIVYNGGLNAYNLTQKVAYARQLIKKMIIDIIIIQDLNVGRRAFFFADQQPQKHFAKDWELYPENLPAMFAGLSYVPKWHLRLLQSATYRLVVAALNRMKLADHLRDCEHEQLWMCFNEAQANFFLDYPKELAERRFNWFVQQTNIPIIRFDSVNETYCEKNLEQVRKNLWHFSLCNMPAFEEYKHMHPPSYVYPEYAKRLGPAVLTVLKKWREQGSSNAQ